MYRLLIVDDEPMVANALYEVFRDIKNLELDVYKTYSGQEAMDFLVCNKVDIVLTDIRMPGMDGLTLLNNIQSNWPQCRVIILTGYNEFDYVYKAIQYKGVSFILKTEGYNKVIEAVQDAVKDINESLEMQNIIQLANEQIALATPILKKNFMLNILKGKIKILTGEQFEELNIPLQLEKDLLMVMGRFDNINPSIEYKKKTEIFYSILLIANEYFKPYLVEAGTYDENDNVIWFLQPKINNALEQKGIKEWKRTDVFLKGMLEMIQVSSRKSMNLNISFSLSSKAIRWSDIQEEYIFLNQLLDFNTGTAEEMILTSSDLRSQHVNPDINKRIKQISVSLKNVNALQNFLEKGQRNEYFKLLEDVIKVFRKIDSLHFNPLLELYYSISVMFLSFINRWGFTEKIAFSIGLSKLTHIEEFSTWEDAKAYIEKISEVIFRLQSEEKKGKTKDVISQVNQFIAENTSEELSLIQISEQVHFNPSYLSRLYKQETGENLSDYITRIRIDKAKFLLENSNLKIHEIAKAVGYETAHNFTRFFKKIMRVTPQEYRDGILKGKQMR